MKKTTTIVITINSFLLDQSRYNLALNLLDLYLVNIINTNFIDFNPLISIFLHFYLEIHVILFYSTIFIDYVQVLFTSGSIVIEDNDIDIGHVGGIIVGVTIITAGIVYFLLKKKSGNNNKPELTLHIHCVLINIPGMQSDQGYLAVRDVLDPSGRNLAIFFGEVLSRDKNLCWGYYIHNGKQFAVIYDKSVIKGAEPLYASLSFRHQRLLNDDMFIYNDHYCRYRLFKCSNGSYWKNLSDKYNLFVTTGGKNLSLRDPHDFSIVVPIPGFPNEHMIQHSPGVSRFDDSVPIIINWDSIIIHPDTSESLVHLYNHGSLKLYNYEYNWKLVLANKIRSMF